MEVIKRGAEAVISKGQWHGRSVVVKERVPKNYRNPELDGLLRRTRIKRECQLIVEARNFGVMTPIIYDVDVRNSKIVMQNIEGTTAKEMLQASNDRMEHAKAVGRSTGLLHANDIVHGDLTTSNMIFAGEGLYFIDFGLGEKSAEDENKGVDLHLLKEAVDSAHSEFPGLYEAMVEGYLAAYPEGQKIVSLVDEIEKRGRYS